MATVTLQGTPVHTFASLPEVGSMAPYFTLTKADLTDTASQDFKGKCIVLNIFPSIDTKTCALSVKRFNSEASALENVAVLCVSMDLPFAQGRFCAAEGLQNVIPLSAFRHTEFGELYGVKIMGGKLQNLFARAVVVIDTEGRVVHEELVAEIAEEPNYDAALAALKACG